MRFLASLAREMQGKRPHKGMRSLASFGKPGTKRLAQIRGYFEFI